MELRIPPLLVALIVGAAIYGVSRVAPSLATDFPGRVGIAAVLLVLGVAVALAGVFEFRRARTTVDPRFPESSTSIVTSGVYRLTRNPMYLGFLLWLIAAGLFLANPVTLVGPIAFVAYMNRFQIRPEERALAARFGSPYESYLARVRRWI
jgi:protein-S-isoprenylcysteine O-methyltransferase Ste14